MDICTKSLPCRFVRCRRSNQQLSFKTSKVVERRVTCAQTHPLPCNAGLTTADNGSLWAVEEAGVLLRPRPPFPTPSLAQAHPLGAQCAEQKSAFRSVERAAHSCPKISHDPRCAQIASSGALAPARRAGRAWWRRRTWRQEPQPRGAGRRLASRARPYVQVLVALGDGRVQIPANTRPPPITQPAARSHRSSRASPAR